MISMKAVIAVASVENIVALSAVESVVALTTEKTVLAIVAISNYINICVVVEAVVTIASEEADGFNFTGIKFYFFQISDYRFGIRRTNYRFCPLD